MADISHTHSYSVDVDEGLHQYAGSVLIGLGDKGADVFKVALTKGGAACADVEEALGFFVRPDGLTVNIEGLVTDNVITLLLPEECYEHAGEFKLTVCAVTTAGDDAVYASEIIIGGRVLVTRTDANADPGSIWSISDLWNAIGDKVDEPAAEGTSGQALLTDGNGGRYWGSTQSAQAVGAVIVDAVTYSLRTGTEGAAGYLTFVEES